MTAKDFQDLGYRISLQVSQAEIDRALYDVFCAYSEWIYPNVGIPSGDYEQYRWELWEDLRDITAEKISSNDRAKQYWYKSALTLTVLLIMQRGSVGTRSGAKNPNTTSATTPNGADIIAQLGREAAMYIRRWCNAFIEQSEQDPDPETQEGLRLYRERMAKVSDICGIFFVSNFLYN